VAYTESDGPGDRDADSAYSVEEEAEMAEMLRAMGYVT
jgi:hypothetical protein